MTRALRMALISLLFFSSGAPWVFLQGFAWVRMSCQRLGSEGVAAAVRSATDGRSPCAMCLAARRGAQETQKSQHSRNRSGAIDFALTSVATIAVTTSVICVKEEAPFRVTQDVQPVEVPPPVSLQA